MIAPLTEQLQAALAAVDAAVENCLAVAALLPGDLSPAERREEAARAIEAYQAAEDALEALLPLVERERPRGSYRALERAASRAWARMEVTAGRVLHAATDAELRAADRAQLAATDAYQRANERHARICGWVADAVIERLDQRRRDAAA
jgi:hypothetical protein